MGKRWEWGILGRGWAGIPGGGYGWQGIQNPALVVDPNPIPIAEQGLIEVVQIQIDPLGLQWLFPGEGEIYPLSLGEPLAVQNLCWIQLGNIVLPQPI